MVSIFGRKASGNVVDARVGRSAGGKAALIGVIGALGGGSVAVGLAGVQSALCFAGLQPCETRIISPQRKAALDRVTEVVLGDTERVWASYFAEQGAVYQPPTLVLHDTEQISACGPVQPGGSPSYCRLDSQIFLDLGYFDKIAKTDRQLSGDFTPVFVVAHEVAHHVQKLKGDLDRIDDAFRGETPETLNQTLVRVELQADCYAGVWTRRADDAYGLLDETDLREAVNTAIFGGDDLQQTRARGFVTESSFTHGSSEQRVRWFKSGLEKGDVADCDTFTPAYDDL